MARTQRISATVVPFAQVDAVDAVGRALVVRDRALVRWSPIHGWRALFEVREPESAGGSD